jgi:hypothetical protein
LRAKISQLIEPYLKTWRDMNRVHTTTVSYRIQPSTNSGAAVYVGATSAFRIVPNRRYCTGLGFTLRRAHGFVTENAALWSLELVSIFGRR